MSLPRSALPPLFGQWLKQERKRLALTQDDLAALIGYSLNAIRKIESGERPPSRQIAELLAEAFAIPADERAAFVHFARVAPTGLSPTAVESDSSGPAPWRRLHRQHSPLPIPPTPLVGRALAVRTTMQQLRQDRTRLLTLIGPPGVGKTRLALEVAAALTAHFAQGVFFVELAPISDPALVVATIARALGLRETGNQPMLDVLKTYLTDKRLLLVLDNFEHVVPAAAQVAALLAGCPWLKVLTTSRVPLLVRGEQQVSVPPLEVPDLTRLPPLAELARLSAIMLFVARAQDVDAAFALAGTNVEAVAAICVRLDGLPLAIELAAVLTNALSPEQIRIQLAARLDTLQGGLRDLPLRQQTLRGAIAWSYDQLDSGEQQLFVRLGIFAGGWTLVAAEAICNGQRDLPLAVSAGLAALVRKSLVQPPRGGGAPAPRFTMLETLGEYAAERLAARGEADALARTHAAYFLGLAEAAAAELLGPEWNLWLNRLEADHANLRAALAWARAGRDPRAGAWGLRLAAALADFWDVRGYWSEGRAALAGALAAAPQNAPGRARALTRAAVFAQRQGDYAAARALAEENLAGQRALGDRAGVAWTQIYLADVVSIQGDYGAARALLEESLALGREWGDRAHTAAALENLGHVMVAQGDYNTARDLWEERLVIARELGSRQILAGALHNLGQAAYAQGDCGAARTLHEESLALFREVGHRQGVAWALVLLGQVAYAQGDNEEAGALLEEGLALTRELMDRRCMAAALSSQGLVALAQEDYGAAWRAYAESLELGRDLGTPLGSAAALAGLGGVLAGQAAAIGGDGAARDARWVQAAQVLGAVAGQLAAMGAVLEPQDRRPYERAVAAVQVQLSKSAFTLAWAAGQAMSLEQIIAYALEEGPPSQVGGG